MRFTFSGAGTTLCLTLLVTLAATPQSASAQMLTEATVFSTDATGTAADGDIWNTVGNDSYYNLWISLNGTAINGPKNAQAGLAVLLSTQGTYNFTILDNPGFHHAYHGLNRFFDGSATAILLAEGEDPTANVGHAYLPDVEARPATGYDKSGTCAAGKGATVTKLPPSALVKDRSTAYAKSYPHFLSIWRDKIETVNFLIQAFILKILYLWSSAKLLLAILFIIMLSRSALFEWTKRPKRDTIYS